MTESEMNKRFSKCFEMVTKMYARIMDRMPKLPPVLPGGKIVFRRYKPIFEGTIPETYQEPPVKAVK